MLDNLTDRFSRFVCNLRGQGKLTESNVRDTVREIRRILLEADVSLPAAKAFVDGVLEKSLGREVLLSITPGQQMIKIIHDELARFLGGHYEPIQFGKSPSPILMVGLNGVGKTTTAAKLALKLKRTGRKPLLVAADWRRPAAALQLETLGRQIDVPVFTQAGADMDSLAREAREHARSLGLDCLIIDSAGRQHIDDELMAELASLHAASKPAETLLVVDGMTGQDAVRSARSFSERIDVTGLVISKLDGDARGGAALSIRWVTGKPVKFVGVGEKLGDFELFHPERMAGRILGMGDVVSLVEKVQESFEAEAAQKAAAKMAHSEFTLENFKEQMLQLKKLGPLEGLIGMIPGAKNALKGVKVDDSQFKVVASIIDSMTARERRSPRIIDGSRRKRIAAGSGRSVQDVNRLLNQFNQMQKMIKQMSQRGGKRHSGIRGLKF